MRELFIQKLLDKMRNDSSVILLTADLGFGLFNCFEDYRNKQYFNVGVSEQLMASMAAGLSIEGFNVFIYSIGVFPTLRCLEQIRNDIDYHNLNVTIVSAGAGLSYGSLGYSHHALQDYALMRSFPNMEIISPGDDNELQDSLIYSFKNPGPKYLRLEKDNKKIFNNKWKKKI